MDWATVATVAVAALGPIAVQLLNGLSRRGDRRHELALEANKRLWDGKRDALIAVISWAKGIQAAATPVTHPMVLQYRRSDILLFAMNNKMPLGDEITAYAGQEVLNCYERLQAAIGKAMQFPIPLMLTQLNEKSQVHEAALRAWEESGKDIAELAKVGPPVAERVQIQANIDDATKSFDPDEVERLASELLAEARGDLRASRP